MDPSQLSINEFWQDSSSVVMQNPRDQAPPELAQSLIEKFPAHLFFQTSGSSGVPKWVALSKSALLASAEAVVEHLEIESGECWACALPTFHVGGVGIYTRALISGGSTKVFSEKWSPHAFAKFVDQHQVAWTSLVPTQVFDLVRAKIPAPRSLKGVIVGGGALASETELAGIQLGWPLLKSYGMSEAGSQIATAKVPGGEMEILPHLELRVDSESVLQWKGKSKFSAYVENSSLVYPSEWVETRDKVRLEGQHLVFITRSDRVVKILGELVDIDSMEAEINRRADQEVVLKLVDNTRRGVKIVPCIERAASESLIELLSKYSGLQKLGPIEIKRFPRSALGKVMRAKL